MNVEFWSASSRTIGQQGAFVAAWLALVEARPEQLTPEEVEASRGLEEDCSETGEAALCSLRGDLLSIRVLTMS